MLEAGGRKLGVESGAPLASAGGFEAGTAAAGGTFTGGGGSVRPGGGGVIKIAASAANGDELSGRSGTPVLHVSTCATMRARAASPSDARSFTHSAMRRVEAPDAALSSADANSRQ